MVAVIKSGSSIHRILNYNENKVKEGVASFIAAVNYPIETAQLSLSAKLNMLTKQAALNQKVTRMSVHASLNFAPSENLSNEQLQAIASTYMQKIGFGEQPYLVYRHFDAGHPHIHIVTIKVRGDGSRIDMQNIGRNQSETARKEIEREFNLVKARDRKHTAFEIKPAYTPKVEYGRMESRRAIGIVLDHVLNSYKYASLPELNAVLKQYNVLADRGSERSRIYQHEGLIYRVLDGQGNPIGVPIKASAFHNKPTLKFLEKKFLANDAARQPFKARVQNAIDFAFLRQRGFSLTDFIQALDKKGIQVVLRQNEAGFVYGVTYVDYRTKCVFNGSALGKEYSAKGIQDRCRASFGDAALQQPRQDQHQASQENLLELLLQPEKGSAYVPYEFSGKLKRRRKKRNSKRL